MNPEIIPADETQYQCRHIFTDGRRCGSPAIRGPEGPDSFCYYHHNSRRPIQHAPTRKRRQSRFTLPNPEDRSAIQESIGEVIRPIASNEIDPRRAGLLLYGLQIASLNLPKSTPREQTTQPVSEVTHDPQHGLLAPPAELRANEPKNSVELLLEHIGGSIDIQASEDSPAPSDTIKSTPNQNALKTLRKKHGGRGYTTRQNASREIHAAAGRTRQPQDARRVPRPREAEGFPPQRTTSLGTPGTCGSLENLSISRIQNLPVECFALKTSGVSRAAGHVERRNR